MNYPWTEVSVPVLSSNIHPMLLQSYREMIDRVAAELFNSVFDKRIINTPEFLALYEAELAKALVAEMT